MTTTPSTADPTGLDLADGMATEAALARAHAVGLFETIDRFRFSDPSHPIPAPGAEAVVDAVHHHAVCVLYEVAVIRMLLAEPSPTPTDRAHLVDAGSRAHDACTAAMLGVRRLAQLGLGVTQHAPDSGEAELVERAMMGALFFDGCEWPVADDDIPIVGTTDAAVAVEIAGLLARTCVEATATATVRDFRVGCRTTRPGVVVAVTTDAVVVDGVRWEIPCSMSLPAAAIVAALRGGAQTTPRDVIVEWLTG